MAKGENIFKRKDGRWEARYIKARDNSGKIRYGFCYGKTYAEAKSKVTEAKARVLNNEALRPAECREKFSCYCGNWLDLRKTQLKTSSYVKYQISIQNHIQPYFGSMYLKDITTEKISEFSEYLLNKKSLSIKSVRDVLTILHSILIYTNRLTGNILSNVDILYPRDIQKSVRVLSEQEESVLVSYLAEDMDAGKFAVYLALRTGMRIGEICALRWSDISFLDETIHIENTVQRIRNTDPQVNSKTILMISSPKSEKSIRTIPLMPDIAALCRKFYQNNPEYFVLTGTQKCMEPRKLQRYLNKYVNDCHLKCVHFHTTRHTFATRCIEAGFDVKTLSKILGHASVSVTLERYVHPNLHLKRENMSRLKTPGCFLPQQSDLPVNH